MTLTSRPRGLLVAMVPLAVSCTPAPPPVSSNVVDVGIPDAGTSAAASAAMPHPGGCVVRWDSCARVAGPTTLSGDHLGQGAEVVWTGSDILVAFEDFPPGQMGTAAYSLRLVAVDRQGHVRWSEALPGRSHAHLAWSARARAGVVMTSESITWLGDDGRPAGAAAPIPRVVNVTFDGVPFVTRDGFVLVSGVGGHARNATPMPFSYAVVGPASGRVEWARREDSGERSRPMGALAPDGTATWVWSSTWNAGASLYPVLRDGSLGPAISATLPTGVRVAAVGDGGSDPFLIVVEKSFQLGLVPVRGGKLEATSALGARSQRSARAELFRVGDALLLGADTIAGSPGVAAAPLRMEASALGPMVAIGAVDSQALRIAATDRGFAAAWEQGGDAGPLIMSRDGGADVHGLSTMLAVYDCCAR